MKKYWSLILLIAILFVAGCSESDAEGKSLDEARVLKVGLSLNEGHPQLQGFEKFTEIIEEKTDGALSIDVYPNAQLGSEIKMVELLQTGSLDITMPSTATLANFVPEFNIYNFPFLISDGEVADAVFESEVAQELLAQLDKSNIKGFSYWEEGHYKISNNIKPIVNADDLKGLKLRTMENEILLESYAALGAVPTPMAFNEVYVALQQGVIDAQTNPYSLNYDQKFYEAQEYVSQTNDFYGVWTFLMSKSTYDSLTPEQQTIVEEAAKEAGIYQIEVARQSEEDYKELIVEGGSEFNDVDPAVRDEWLEMVQPVIDKHTVNMDQDIVERFYEVIENAKK